MQCVRVRVHNDEILQHFICSWNPDVFDLGQI